MKRTLISLLLCAVALVAIATTARASPIKVLHVSEVMQSEVQVFIDDAGAGSLFDVTQVSHRDEDYWEHLEEYDVIVFGLSDCFDIVRDLDELLWFVEGGGGVVFTHDSASNINPPAVRNMVGVGEWINPPWVWGNSAEIIQDHAVLHCPFEIGSVGESLEVQWTHTIVTLESAEKILKLPGPDESNNFYLAAKEYGAGRVVVSEIGHSVYQCAGEPGEEPLVLREQQLFVNCLYWVGIDPIELCADLIMQVAELGLPTGIETSLNATLEAAARALDNHNIVAAINTLQAFINAVEAKRDKKISDADADALIAAAQQIIDLLMAE